jgi:cyclic pyranopterin phosphate synthase
MILNASSIGVSHPRRWETPFFFFAQRFPLVQRSPATVPEALRGCGFASCPRLQVLARCGFLLHWGAAPLSPSSHFDAEGNAHMVDVSGKPITVREATAQGELVMRSATAEMIRNGTARKGDVLGVARLAAIQATKLTQQLIPLCHAIPIESVGVDFDWPRPENQASESRETAVLRCLVTVRTSAKTGVEMEAMTGASVACLTVYDMVKSVDREVSIGPIELLAKSGGKSGDFRRQSP